MLEKKCSRCGQQITPFEGGKINDEFLCESCLKDARANGEVDKNLKAELSFISIGALRVVAVIYLVYSIFRSFSLPNAEFESLLSSIMTFFVIWVFTVMVKVVVKIYNRISHDDSGK